ncbi:MAG: DUF1330 domain-containing protein [Oleispira sp.]
MTAYIVVDLTPINAEKMQEYGAAAAVTVAEHGGEFVVKGPISVLNPDEKTSMDPADQYATKVIIQFPDHDTALAWYNSDAYQAIIPTRKLAMKSQFHIIG